MKLKITILTLCLALATTTTTAHEGHDHTMDIKVKKRMHVSWDQNGDGVNDCEQDGSCDDSVDYTAPKPGWVQPPSFDCAAAKLSSAEQAVCKDPKLTKLDRTLAITYKKALTRTKTPELTNTLKAEQRGWIKGRDECWKAEALTPCIEQSYKMRTAELLAKYNLIRGKGPVLYMCENNPANEFIGNYYATDPATLILERGDQSQLLYSQASASGTHYSAGDYELVEHQGKITITWGYQTKPFACQVKP